MNTPVLTPDELAHMAAPIYASMLAVSASDDNPTKPDYKGLMSEAIEHAAQLHQAATLVAQAKTP